MLAVLSPAKSLDLTPPPISVSTTEPALMKDAANLMKTTRGLSQTKVRELMSISPDLAKLNYDRFRSFELPFTDKNAMPAALMFDGDVYRGLSARTLDTEALKWAQGRVAILSGLFGLLRPLDRIQPYRLEMGTKLSTRRGKNLYAYWDDRIRKQIAGVVADHGDPTLVNLASAEYFKATQAKKLDTPVLRIVFEDWKDGKKPNVVSFMAKYARGAMARFIIEERIDQCDGLKDFRKDRYRFQKARSTDSEWVFGRKFVPVAKAG
ncbi:MAG: peroxide stress protein YaaA [Myxococcota bacterium]